MDSLYSLCERLDNADKRLALASCTKTVNVKYDVVTQRLLFQHENTSVLGFKKYLSMLKSRTTSKKKKKKATDNYGMLHSLGSHAVILSKVKSEINESLCNKSDKSEVQRASS